MANWGTTYGAAPPLEAPVGKPLEPRHTGQLRHSHEVKTVRYRPDGTILASAGYDKRLQFWRLPDLKNVLTICVDDYIETIDWSSDGGLIACGGMLDNTARVYDYASGEDLFGEDLKHEGVVYAVAFSRTADMLVCGCFAKKITVWDAKKGHLVTTLAAMGVVKALAWGPDGTMLASGGFDAAVSVWRTDPAASEKPSEESLAWRSGLGNAAADCLALAFSPDGKLLASADWARHVTLWDAVTGGKVHVFELPDRLHAVAFSPRSDLVACGGWKCRVALFDVASKAQVDTLYIGAEHEDDAGGQWVRDVEFSPDGGTVAVCSDDHAVHLWPRSPLWGNAQAHSASEQSGA
ncbi:WD40-repeat-containing domain protein [Pelagophyceae sp. CCMP2097]|nr:WD40-repeat-containing domain protein [Pelagophyceae sp. CCMP2097]